MRTEKIWDKDGKSFVRTFSSDVIEQVNPVEYYLDSMIFKNMIMDRDLLEAKSPFLASQLPDSFFLKRATERAQKLISSMRENKVDQNFLKIFEKTRKKDQLHLLKGQTVDSDQLFDLICSAYEEYGFLYSKYRFETLDPGSQQKVLPKIIHQAENGEIHKIGDTDATDGELKRVLLHRKVIVAHIFEKENCWHSLFLTFNSLKGEENWKNGQAHFHYISSGFNLTKEQFIESMKTGNYLSTSVHIPLKDYGFQSGE